MVGLFSFVYLFQPRAVRKDHFLLPSLVSSQDLQGCMAAALRKLSNLLQLQDQLLADLPSAYMEAYEFLAIAKVGSGDSAELCRYFPRL